jgi:hypothetical protein
MTSSYVERRRDLAQNVNPTFRGNSYSSVKIEAVHGKNISYDTKGAKSQACLYSPWQVYTLYETLSPTFDRFDDRRCLRAFDKRFDSHLFWMREMCDAPKFLGLSFFCPKWT